jgi:hypothetical protein
LRYAISCHSVFTIITPTSCITPLLAWVVFYYVVHWSLSLHFWAGYKVIFSPRMPRMYSFWEEEEDWIMLLRGGDELTGGRRRQKKVAVVTDDVVEWIDEATEIVPSPLVLQELLRVCRRSCSVCRRSVGPAQQDVRCSFQ